MTVSHAVWHQFYLAAGPCQEEECQETYALLKPEHALEFVKTAALVAIPTLEFFGLRRWSLRWAQLSQVPLPWPLLRGSLCSLSKQEKESLKKHKIECQNTDSSNFSLKVQILAALLPNGDPMLQDLEACLFSYFNTEL